jgi:hypothetical protein
MADAAIFVGFGAPARARERQAVALLEEWVAFCSGLRDRGELESFEPVLLDPHGGDLGGFLLLRGEAERLDRLRRDGEFRRLSVRTGLVVDGFGVVGAHTGDALGTQLSLYGNQVEEQLASS